MSGVVLMTILFSFFAIDLKMDSSGFFYNGVDPLAFEEYQEFKKSFGNDETVFIAVKNQIPASDPRIQKSLANLGEVLSKQKNIARVVNVSSLNITQLNAFLGVKDFWDPGSISKLKTILPGISGLISDDLKTIAFAVEFKKINQNGFVFLRQLNEIQTLIEENFPGMPQCHFVGYPVLQAAFERYNISNTATYIILGLIIGTLAAFYIFKSLKVSLIVTVSCAIATIWTTGLVVLSGMKLTIMSGISVCFIILVSTTTVMHIVSKYYELVHFSQDFSHALKRTLVIVLRPCFMCALTTSAGFASLMISPVKMIRDTGLMISMGVLNSFCIALVVSVFILTKIAPPKDAVFIKIENDLMAKFLQTGLSHGLKKPGRSLWAGLVLVVILCIGSFFVEKSNAPIFQVSVKTKEAKSIAFFQKELNSGYHISMIIKSVDNNVTSGQLWGNLHKFEQKIKSFEFIQRVDSLSSLVYYLVRKVPFGNASPERVVKLLLSNEATRDIAREFISQENHQIRVVLHLPVLDALDFPKITTFLQEEANKMFKGTADISFQGLLVLQEQQKKKILTTQLRSLALALGLITLLMIIQLRSLTLGLISLIPNALPLLTMFGLMGILKIPLDPLIIFAVIVSFGLSVDDSIHFLTQLKREISKSKSRERISQYLGRSFQVTSRALLSTTAVLFLSSLSFLLSSFDHVFSIGLLIASASATALYADLVLLIALIIKARPLQQFLLRKKGQVYY